MSLRTEPLTLHLAHPFHIAHGVSEQRENVLVRLGEGFGEGASVGYLGESHAGIAAYLAGLELHALGCATPEALQEFLVATREPSALDRILAELPRGSAAARAAFDMALHDAWGKAHGQPLYRLLGRDPARIPETSFTIPIGAPRVMAERASSVAMPVLKIKLGAADDADAARITAVRARVPGRRLWADANGGWTLPRAERLLPLLAECGVELVEQPLPPGELDGLRALSRLSKRPALFVDESIREERDIAAHAGLVDGVVVKLAKSGGMAAASRQVAAARARGLAVMVGCMIESSLGVAAAAHVAMLADHADLDGPLLVTNDPFEGLSYQGSRAALSGGAGLGVRLRAAAQLSDRAREAK